MPQQVRRKRGPSIQISAFGTKYVQQLSRGMVMRELALRLSGSVTFGLAASNAAATAGRGDEWAVISRIDIVANGADIVRSFSGHQLRMFNRLIYGSQGRIAPAWGDGTTANPAFDSTLILPFWQPLSVKPMDTALDTSRLSDLRIEITSETANGIQNAASATAVNATLDVVSMESFGVDLLAADCKIYPLQDTVSAANDSRQVQLPVSALYRGFIINAASDGSTLGIDAVNSITNVKLVSGTTTFFDVPWAVLRDWQRQRLMQNNRDYTQATAGAAPISGGYNNAFRSLRNAEDAWTFLDLIPDGYLTEGIDSVGLSELFLEFKLSAATTITVLPIQIFPRRGAKAA